MAFKIDGILPPGLAAARDAAGPMEALGYDGLWSTETTSEPFLDLAAVALETSRPLIGTNLAIAFARSPFVTAVASWQLHRASGGRFVLGLGTQVKGHIERRFGMAWESPGPKLREYVQALQALWAAFQGQRPLDFRGRFYTHTVISPFFDPGPIDHPPPKVWLAAVNEYNAETCGLVADGILVHPVHSRRYVEQVLMPAIERGLAKSGRSRSDITVMCPVFLVVGRDAEEAAASDAFVRSQIAFYGSTRTYSRIFTTHGWNDTPTRLHQLMGAGDLGAMPGAISDEMLSEFAITGHPDDVVGRVRERYDGLADRLYFYNLFTSPFAGDDGRQRELIAALSS
ncbi:MAG TPA: TIGR03617 family F420-dependent LLM class oxidoreductase [Actinomycetota bacterium]|nr:TIGR03617 family F420-dependent LLM class oxidoreductase [Actinomycetota bacterium]